MVDRTEMLDFVQDLLKVKHKKKEGEEGEEEGLDSPEGSPNGKTSPKSGLKPTGLLKRGKK